MKSARCSANSTRCSRALRESREQLLTQQHELTDLNQANQRLLDEVRVKSERLQRLLHRAITAQEAERQRLARELHDETGQALTSLTLQLKALQEESDLDVIHDRLNGLRYLTSRTVEEVRRLSIDLRPAALDDLGLVPAIRAYLDDWAQAQVSNCSSSARIPWAGCRPIWKSFCIAWCKKA